MKNTYIKQNLKKVQLGNINHIIYYENDQVSRKHTIEFYQKLSRVSKTGLTISPHAFAGPDLRGNSYESIIIEEPKNNYEYLRSPYVAIPFTQNKIVTDLYYNYYFEKTLPLQTPKSLKLCWPPFEDLSKEDYQLEVVPPMLIGFIEACLSTKKVLGSTQNFKSYAYLLGYNYLEHGMILNQYTTYEQKGIELYRGDLLDFQYNYTFGLHNLSFQFREGVIPFILNELSITNESHFLLKNGSLSLAHDFNMLIKALVFIYKNPSIERKLLNEYNMVLHPRGHDFDASYERLELALSHLKKNYDLMV